MQPRSDTHSPSRLSCIWRCGRHPLGTHVIASRPRLQDLRGFQSQPPLTDPYRSAQSSGRLPTPIEIHPVSSSSQNAKLLLRAEDQRHTLKQTTTPNSQRSALNWTCPLQDFLCFPENPPTTAIARRAYFLSDHWNYLDSSHRDMHDPSFPLRLPELHRQLLSRS